MLDRNPRLALGLIAALVAPITLMHYITDIDVEELHNVYRRLYYVPIVLGAFSGGVRGGLILACVATFGYIPHAFFSHHPDHLPALDKALEIVLYFSIGGFSGWLVDRQARTHAELQRSLDERNALEDQLVRAGKLSALGEMSSGLAHEIRNPLASILGAAESLVAGIEPENRRYRIGQLLIHEVHRLNGVVTRFSSFAKLTPIHRSGADIMALAREVCDLSHAEAGSRGVEVVVADEGLMLELDSEQVVQVLLNVLLNAYEASSAVAEPRVEIGTGRRVVGDRSYACLYIADNGPGIPAGLTEQIFDPYFTTREDGTGLGLSISSRIMEAHGGFVDFERVGGQTLAWLCFPEDE